MGAWAALWIIGASAAVPRLETALEACAGDLGLRWTCVLPTDEESAAAGAACEKGCPAGDPGERCRIACERAAMRDAEACEQRRGSQLAADLARCRSELFGEDDSRVPDLLVRERGSGWYPVPVEPVTHEEYPTACERDAPGATASPAGSKGFRCAREVESATLAPLVEQAEALVAEQEDLSPDEQLAPADIRHALAAKSAEAMCPKGMRMEWDDVATCARTFSRKEFCPKGNAEASNTDAGCGYSGCPGRTDLSKLSGSRLRGCAQCPMGGRLDAPATARWAEDRGTATEVLCRVRLADWDAAARRRVKLELARRTAVAQGADAAMRASLAERGLAADRVVALQRIGTRWPPVFRLVWKAGEPGTAPDEAKTAAAAIADALPDLSTLRLVAADGSGRASFVADFFAGEPSRLFNAHSAPSAENDW